MQQNKQYDFQKEKNRNWIFLTKIEKKKKLLQNLFWFLLKSLKHTTVMNRG